MASLPPTAPRVVDARFVASATATGQLPPPIGLEIAFVGRSNVGKSTLLNGLMGRRNLARTSRTPGCTRLISCFEVKLADGALLRLIDLPGYGYARRSKTERRAWAAMIEGYLRERVTLAAAVVLVDSRRGAEAEEHDLIELLGQPAAGSRRPLSLLTVATKLDKLARSEQKPTLERLRRELGRPVIGVSISDPRSLSHLWQRLRSAIGFLPESSAADAD